MGGAKVPKLPSMEPHLVYSMVTESSKMIENVSKLSTHIVHTIYT